MPASSPCAASGIFWKPAMPRSLRATLALWLTAAGAAVILASVALTQNAVARLADSAYDRSLSGALRAVEENVSVQSGGLGIDLPYALFANLQATTDGTVYFRIRTEDGLVQIGDTGLPEPPTVPVGVPRFFDAAYLGEQIRVAAIRKRLDAPLYGKGTPQTVLIEVAETTTSREAFLGRIARVSFWRDVAVLGIAVAVLVLGTGAALRPLSRLRDRFDRRRPDDLSPLEASEVPSEVRPLVESFNALLARHAAQAAARKRFLDDASHQLRTPISVLRMQLDYAIAADEAERAATLNAMHATVERATRSTAQLLALARADAAVAPMGPVDPAALLRAVAMLHLAAARRRRIVLDLDLPDDLPMRHGSEALLHDALSNLLDNAIRLSPDGATIEIGARHDRLWVADRGPGMTGERLARLGERFLTDGGTGLGLSVAQAVARMHGGTLTARNRSGGGLEVTLHLP